LTRLLLAQLDQARRVGNRLERRDVQFAVVIDGDLGAVLDSPGDLSVGDVEIPGVAVQQLGRVLGQPERPQQRPLRALPRLA